jgi:hypothetical protein
VPESHRPGRPPALSLRAEALLRAISELPGPGWLAAETEETPRDVAVGCQHVRELMADELKKLELF